MLKNLAKTEKPRNIYVKYKATMEFKKYDLKSCM